MGRVLLQGKEEAARRECMDDYCTRHASMGMLGEECITTFELLTQSQHFPNGSELNRS